MNKQYGRYAIVRPRDGWAVLDVETGEYLERNLTLGEAHRLARFEQLVDEGADREAAWCDHGWEMVKLQDGQCPFVGTERHDG